MKDDVIINRYEYEYYLDIIDKVIKDMDYGEFDNFDIVVLNVEYINK